MLLAFFQKIDPNSGTLIHDFTDPAWDTRFLGDLYQDLSEAARKKYALLQTPVFVEEFILDRTLDPAIEEFGLAKCCATSHASRAGRATSSRRPFQDDRPGVRQRPLPARELCAAGRALAEEGAGDEGLPSSCRRPRQRPRRRREPVMQIAIARFRLLARGGEGVQGATVKRGSQRSRSAWPAEIRCCTVAELIQFSISTAFGDPLSTTPSINA